MAEVGKQNDAVAQKLATFSAEILAPELDPQVATEARVRRTVGSVSVDKSKESQALAIIEGASPRSLRHCGAAIMTASGNCSIGSIRNIDMPVWLRQ
jgi:hypothetical protein